MPPPREEELPASLLASFVGAMRERLVALLRFLSPLTVPGS